MADTIIEITGGMFDSTEVVETVDGFPVGNKAVGSDFFAKMISTLYTSGIAVRGDPDGFAVTAGSGMNLKVAPGAAWLEGYMAWNKTEVTVPILGGKNYALCLRRNLTDGTCAILCLENPGAGDYPLRNGQVYDLVLALVTVPYGVVTAAGAVITDCRYDTELCGVVTSAVAGLDTIAFAANAGQLGGYTAAQLLPKSGGVMTGKLTAAGEGTGMAAVRNISYGTVLPDTLPEGELFILLA